MDFLTFSKKIVLSNLGLLNAPYKLNFAVTYKCNSRCKICNIWAKKPKNELKIDEIENISSKNKFFSWLSLTGGEPFLRKDIVDIAKTFNENSDSLYILNIPTNGSMPKIIEEKVEEMTELGIPKIVITPSLDGPKDTHDNVRGKRGSWEKAVETFVRLKEISKSKGNLDVVFSLTISPFNVGTFNDTIKAVKTIYPVSANDFHINIFHFSKHFYSNSNFPIQKYKTYKDELLKEIDMILSLKKMNYLNPISFIDNRYLKLAKIYVEAGKLPFKCSAMTSSIFLDPFGNIYPCTSFSRILGNLRVEYDILKILRKEESAKVKGMVEAGSCPICWTPCEANQTIINNLLRW